METAGADPSSAPEPAPAAEGLLPTPPEVAAPAPSAAARKKKGARPHPYIDEVSTARELNLSPSQVTLFWGGLATALVVVGFLLANRFSPVLSSRGVLTWAGWTDIALFGGLGLLGFGFLDRAWAKRATMAGWLLFAFYWALVAQDLFVEENGDYVNLAFAVIGTYFFTYLAYHQWLNEVRGVENRTVRFLNISTFVAAGSYFVIDKLEPLRTWLILKVSGQTFWMLNLFGQGSSKGLVYSVDLSSVATDAPGFGQDNITQFWYPSHLNTVPAVHGFWGHVLHFDPVGGSAAVIPVSIILACTALQSLMLFVGLFMGTSAPWRKKVWASVIVAALVYGLNLIRNTGIIWFYGQGDMSFWVIHDAIGKGGSLIAMIGIAFGCFAWFPEFLTGLVGVLDLPHRDGPLERTLHLGRRRPEALPPAPPATPPA